MYAHRARLWNKVLGYKPVVPKGDMKWDYVHTHNNKVFAVLSILNYLLATIALGSKWKRRLITLFEEYPHTDKSRMSFPKGWQTSLLWAPDKAEATASMKE